MGTAASLAGNRGHTPPHLPTLASVASPVNPSAIADHFAAHRAASTPAPIPARAPGAAVTSRATTPAVSHPGHGGLSTLSELAEAAHQWHRVMVARASDARYRTSGPSESAAPHARTPPWQPGRTYTEVRA